VSAVEARAEPERVTPRDLFFDLAFLFAIAQVTSLMARVPTWQGLAMRWPRTTAWRRARVRAARLGFAQYSTEGNQLPWGSR
jgi:hypothetical protein